MKVNGFSALMFASAAIWALLLSWQVASGSEALTPPAAQRPAELPPADFRAAQYIDSAGCVFVREGSGWSPRQDRNGAPICGYPPTLSARRTAPAELAPLFPGPVEDDAVRIARELTETVMARLQTGELAGTGEAGAETAGPAIGRPEADDSASLPRMIAAVPQLRAEMGKASAGNHTAQLCRLLGAEPFGGGGPGAQDALGLCGAMTAVDLPRRAVSVASASAAPARKPQDAQATAPAPAQKAAPVAARTPAETQRASAKARREPESEGRAGMIPPGARFVQVGMFRDEASVQRTARRLAALGLPVARAEAALEGERLVRVLAGPFDSREKLVRALHKVRGGGFPNAYPR